MTSKCCVTTQLNFIIIQKTAVRTIFTRNLRISPVSRDYGASPGVASQLIAACCASPIDQLFAKKKKRWECFRPRRNYFYFFRAS